MISGDNDELIAAIEAAGVRALILSRHNRKSQRKTGRHGCKVFETSFNCFKQFRRLATRYGKLASRFMVPCI